MTGAPATTTGGSPRRARPSVALGVVAVLVALFVAACGGGDDSSGGEVAPVTTVPTDLVVATDPAVPVTVAVGHRFAVVLPADPGEGWRWVVEPFDTNRLVALGSEFSDDPAQRAASTAATSTTSTTAAARAGASTTTTPTIDATTPTTTEPPLVQIVSFAGRSTGTTTLSFRASQIVPAPDARPVVVRWTVQIVATPPTTR